MRLKPISISGLSRPSSHGCGVSYHASCAGSTRFRILLLLLIIISVVCCFSSSETVVTLTKFPPIWDESGLLEQEFFVSSSQNNFVMASITIQIYTLPHYTPVEVSFTDSCSLFYGNTLVNPEVLSISDDNLTINIEFQSPSPGTSDQFRWRCQTKLSGGTSPSPMVLVETSMTFDGLTEFATNQQYLTTTGPSFIHEFLWKDSALHAKFYFSPLKDGTNSFSIEHPLFLYTSVESIHGVPTNDDLLRPYHLLSQRGAGPGFECRDTRTVNERSIYPLIEFGSDNKSKLVVSPTAAIEAEFSCTFTIPYHPDHLRSLFDADISSTWTLDNGEPTPKSFPFNTGKEVLATDSSQRIYAWISFNHMDNRTPTSFSVSIAVASHYLDEDGRKMEFEDNPDDLKISAALVYFGEGVTYKTRIRCYDTSGDDVFVRTTSSNLSFDLNDIEAFQGFGLTCDVLLTEIQGATDRGVITIRPKDKDPIPIIVYDAYGHQVAQPSLPYPFYLDEQINTRGVVLHDDEEGSDVGEIGPTGIPADLSTEGPTNNPQYYATVRMHIQPLVVSVRTTHDTYYLHLVLAAFQAPEDILPLHPNESPDLSATVTISSQGFTIFEGESIMSVFGRNHAKFVTKLSGVSDIFTKNFPIRSPSGVIPLTVNVLDPSQPLDVTVKFPTVNPIDFGNLGLMVYPVLLPRLLSAISIYSPSYAVITFPSPPRLSFSYRCVSWDNIRGPYAYKLQSGEKLTTETSVECPPYIDPDTNQIDVTSNYWKIIHSNFILDSLSPPEQPEEFPVCFYQLAAVCVSPSTDTDGVFEVYPLAHCQSFLGGVHAVPCAVADAGESEYSDEVTISSQYDFKTFDVSLNSESTLVFSWDYVGDPRLRSTISLGYSVSVQQSESNQHTSNVMRNAQTTTDTEDDNLVWIKLAENVPSYISPSPSPSDSSTPSTTFTLPFPPLFFTGSPTVHVKIELDVYPGVSKTMVIENVDYSPSISCNTADHYMVDPATLLCVCAPGYAPNQPIGRDNPYANPADFTCVSVCGGNYQWQNGRCNCDGEKYLDPIYCKYPSPAKNDAKKCHDIPPGTSPRFSTQVCGNGIAKNHQNCNDCDCFPPWDLDSEGKCTVCSLSTSCSSHGTLPRSYEDPVLCWYGECLCAPGYAGPTCESRVMYGTLLYTRPATFDDHESLVDTSRDVPHILTRKRIELLESRVLTKARLSLGDAPITASIQQVTQALLPDTDEVLTTLVLALGRRLSEQSSPYMMGVYPAFDTSVFSLSSSMFLTDDGSESSESNENLGDLYHAWQHLYDNYQDRPINSDPEFGELDGAEMPYDPFCLSTPHIPCPNGPDNLIPPDAQIDPEDLQDIPYFEAPDGETKKRKSTTLIIIGAVLGAVVLLFLLLVMIILYCRKHETACFKKKTRKTGKGSSNTNSQHGSTPASASIAGTNERSGVEMISTLPPSSNLPTIAQIDDPTLPADWIALEDKNTGKIYYSNKITMESSWQHPLQPKDDELTEYGW